MYRLITFHCFSGRSRDFGDGQVAFLLLWSLLFSCGTGWRNGLEWKIQESHFPPYSFIHGVWDDSSYLASCSITEFKLSFHLTCGILQRESYRYIILPHYSTWHPYLSMEIQDGDMHACRRVSRFLLEAPDDLWLALIQQNDHAEYR